MLLTRGNLCRREVSRCHIVVVPEAEMDAVPAREQLPHLRREDPKVRARIRGGFWPGVRGKNMQHAGTKRAVLALLAPNPRRKIHQRGERAIGPAQRPYSGKLLWI